MDGLGGGGGSLGLTGEAAVSAVDLRYSSTFSMGLEYAAGDLFTLRAGYRLANDFGLKGVTGLSAGMGLRISGVSVGYAFVPVGELGNGNQVNLGLKF